MPSKTYPVLHDMIQLSRNCNTVLIGMMWNVNHNPKSHTLTLM